MIKCSNVSYAQCKKFYKTEEWQILRDTFILKQKFLICKECDYPRFNGGSKQVHEYSVSSFDVDHKEPIKYRWDLRLDENNLQILCKYCNKKKGNNRLGWL